MLLDSVLYPFFITKQHAYTIALARGDNKAAKYRLRGLAQHKTHHFSTFRTGLLLGLALPAFVDGLYLSEYDSC
jgi:xenotropic and polytropic retrovirus receptor 1